MAHDAGDGHTGFLAGPVSDLSSDTIRDLFVRLDTVERAEKVKPTARLAKWEAAIRAELRRRRQHPPQQPRLRPAG
jgi:hypothetical protein